VRLAGDLVLVAVEPLVVAHRDAEQPVGAPEVCDWCPGGDVVDGVQPAQPMLRVGEPIVQRRAVGPPLDGGGVSAC